MRIGINPISWSNDDLPSLGGETPLEIALAEGKAIGYEGFELGNKFPREPQALRDGARAPRARAACPAGTRAGSRGARSRRRSRRSARISRLLAENGAKVMVYGEVADAIQGAPQPLYQRPRFFRDDAVARVRRARSPRSRGTRSQRGVRLALSPSHGRVRRDARRRRSADGGHRRRGRPAVRQRPHDVRRRRRGRDAREARRARLPRALQGRAARRDPARAQPQLELPRVGDQRRVHRAGRRRGRLSPRCSASCATHGYRGWLVVEAEQDPVVAPSYAYAEKGYRHLRELVDALGASKRSAA